MESEDFFDSYYLHTNKKVYLCGIINKESHVEYKNNKRGSCQSFKKGH